MAKQDESLRGYNEKRDFKRTPEPRGRASRRRRRAGGPRFVVQKHAATRLHYDFRLEHDGVLKSWAVTKGPSLDPQDKRLAVRTEDHPLDYGDFEGIIPQRQYGGGTVMLWDEGTWEPQEDPDEGLKSGKLKFTLNGQRMRGGWALVRMRTRDKRENWLLIKEKDDFARRDGDTLTEDADTSVRSGRSMAEIAEDRDRQWNSEGNGEEKAGSSKSGAKTRKKGGGARPPKFVAPQLATLVDEAPEGDGWLHEIKYDGYRAIVSLGAGEVVIRTRNGKDWTDRFRALAGPLGRLDAETALLDGEIAVADDEGHTDFGALQKALSDGRSDMLTLYLFDLLHLDGEDLRKAPLTERKKKLKALLGGNAEGPLVYSDHVEGSGGHVYRHACDMALEGIVSKRADAPYRSGRGKSWLKVKCGMGQEFVIIGWRPSDKKGRPFSSLLLGVHEGGTLRYTGRVGSGFSDADFEALWPRLSQRARKTAPAEDIPREVRRDARYVTPDLVAEIALRGWTREGYVRQGSFKGLRADKPAREIRREKAGAANGAAGTSGRNRTMPSSMSGGDAIEVEGVRVTHPDRVLFPGQGVTKRDLIDHYLAVADAMLPHVAGRPLSLVRCPQGQDGECFYQKHASKGFPDAFKAVEIAEKSGTGEYLYIEDRAGLVAAVQMGVLELHVWGARTDRLERPDRMILDIDPDTGVPFDKVREAAGELRQRLDELGLVSFLLATGGKGLHVVLPLERRHAWDDHKAFAEALARRMAQDAPARYTTNMSKAKRKDRIFIDYLRNDRGATAIAPFSSRAREGAPVAVPLGWNALGRLKSANGVTVKTCAGWLKKQKSDPWEGYFDLRQRLPLKELGLD